MIVELDGEGPIAYGVLPGGQSGNPGSDKYIYSLENWVNGEYHRLNFLRSSDEMKEDWSKFVFKSKTK